MVLKLNLFTKICFLILCNAILTYLNKILIETDELYIKSLSDKLSSEQLDILLHAKSNNTILFSLLEGLVLILPLLATTTTIYIGIYLSELKIEFRDILSICVNGWFIFIFMGFLKFYWLYYLINPDSLTYYQDFIPFSMLNLFKYSDLSFIERILYRSINIFEIFFILYLIKNIRNNITIQDKRIETTIITTYVVSVLLFLGMKILIFT